MAGKMPDDNDEMKSIESGLHSVSAHSFSNKDGMPSGPE